MKFRPCHSCLKWLAAGFLKQGIVLPLFLSNLQYAPASSMTSTALSGNIRCISYCTSGLQLGGFEPKLVYVGFVVDYVAIGEGFFRVLLFSPVNIVTRVLHTHSLITVLT